MKKNIFRVLWLTIFIACTLLVNHGWSATYYVKNAGEDTGSGLSNEEAWRTISKVNSYSFVPGDTVCFKRGDVFDDATLRTPSVDNFTIQSYGPEDKPKPWFNGNLIRPIYIKDNISNLTIKNIDISGQGWEQGKDDNLRLYGVNGIIIDGVIGNGHKGWDGSTKGKNGIRIRDNCSGIIEIKNCSLYNWGPQNIPSQDADYMGIALTDLAGAGTTVKIHDNIVHDVNADCLYFYNTQPSTQIYNNILYNAGENCMDLKDASNLEVYHNEMYRKDAFTGRGGNASDSYPLITMHGLYVSIAKNNVIRDNYFHDCDWEGVRTSGDPGVENIKIYKNKFVKCGGALVFGGKTKDVEFHHNVVINPVLTDTGNDRGAIYQTGPAVTNGVKIFNNTIYHDGSTSSKIMVNINTINDYEIKDNIVYMNSDNSSAYCLLVIYEGNISSVIQNNCWYNKFSNHRIKYVGNYYPVDKLNDWINIGHPGELFEDPLFNNAEIGDFSLSEFSPCREEDRILGAFGIAAPRSVTVEIIKN